MKALTVFFDSGEQWRKMLEVCKLSWAQYHDIPLEVIQRDPPYKTSGTFGLDTNTLKLNLWEEYFDQDTIFLDCDMLFRGNLTDGFDSVSGIGYTTRQDSSGFPFNAGVIFARYTPYTQKFMKKWVQENMLLYNNKKLWHEWGKVIPGINQPALAKMMAGGWAVDPLPDIYNMCDMARWQYSRAVHIKSKMRAVCFASRKNDLRTESERALHSLFWSYLGGVQFVDVPQMIVVRKSGAKRTPRISKRALMKLTSKK